jgi:3-hydroxymyristoyl/3-hydroxydecanoyl-(acyl carrier protein) dehydratase
MIPQQDAESALGPWRVTAEAAAEAAANFSPHLPVFVGHFPGNPLVPGVHQSALILALVRQATGRRELTLRQVVRCKWTRPVRPGDALLVRASWRISTDGLLIDGDIRYVDGLVAHTGIYEAS